jgi:hypothetical protein
MLRVFENRVLRRIFGLKRDKATGQWRRLRNEELYVLHSAPNIIRMVKLIRLRWAGHVTRREASIGAYKVMVGKPQGRTSLARPRNRCVDNLKLDLRAVG